MIERSEPHTAPQNGQTADSVRRPPRRWLWIALCLSILLHRAILGGIGGFLSIGPAAGPHDAALLLSGDHRVQAAADLFAQGLVESVWLVQDRPKYLERHGLLPPNWDVSRTALIEAGIPPGRIEILDGEAGDATDMARIVSRRLAQSPQASILTICEGFECRHLRIVFDEVVGEDHASRIRFRGLPYEAFEMSTWWTSRNGCKEVFSHWCSIAFTVIRGTNPRDLPESMDPDAYERQLKRDFGEAACHGL